MLCITLDAFNPNIQHSGVLLWLRPRLVDILSSRSGWHSETLFQKKKKKTRKKTIVMACDWLTFLRHRVISRQTLNLINVNKMIPLWCTGKQPSTEENRVTLKSAHSRDLLRACQALCWWLRQLLWHRHLGQSRDRHTPTQWALY